MNNKKNILKLLSNKKNIILEIGSGSKKIYNNSISIDIIDSENVDIVGDIHDVIKLFESNSVDKIYSSHCLEHIKNLEKLFIEITRVLKINGELELIIPHFSNPFYYSDPTHVNFFGLYTFSYYFHDNYLKRKVPAYKDKLPLEISNINLIFRSFRPRYVTHGIKKIFQFVFNLSVFFKELYEENFTNLISCYEIQIKLKKINEKK